MRYGFINNFSQLLASDLAIGATTMTLDGGGALLVNASADLVYTLTLDDGNGTTEIVHVTAVTTNTLTVVRGQEGTTAQAWPTGSTVEMRVTAGVMGVVAGNVRNIAIGDQSVVAAGEWDDATAVGAESIATGSSSVAVGLWAEATDSNAAAVGRYARAHGMNSAAVGSSSQATGSQSVAVGSGPVALGATTVAIGRMPQATKDHAIALGNSANAYSEDGVSVGQSARTGSSTLEAPRAVAIGRVATVEAGAAEGVALGYGAEVTVAGGVRIHGVPYLPAVPRDHVATTTVNTAKRCTQQVSIQTDTLDLADGAAFVTLDLPAGTMLFIDAVDIVITGSTTPGGAPEIRVGPDDVTPAAYLAATAVIGTAVGARQTHAPLVGDGVTALRVETVAAGTGTLTAKIVFRGYVMEL